MVDKFEQLLPWSASPNSAIHSLQVHLQTRPITAAKWISILAPLWTPSSHNHCLQVHLHIRSITAFKYVIQGQQWVYIDRVVTDVDRVRGSIYLADPGVDRPHLISITSNHTMKIHSEFFRTVVLTCSVWDFMDRLNCVDPEWQVVSYNFTQFLHTLNHNHSFLWILLECYKRCCRVLKVGSLPSSSIIWLQWLQVVHLNVFAMGLSRCSSNYAWLPSVAWLTDIYIYRDLSNACHMMM